MNEFYSIGPLNKELDNPYQLNNLGTEIPMVSFGKRSSSYWGDSGKSSETYYRKTTPKDYDGNFAYRLSIINPPYDLSKFLDYHLDHYLTITKGIKEKFIKHIKYVIIPLVIKKREKEVYISLIEEWLEENDTNRKLKQMPTMNIITTGDINSPTQFQQDVKGSNQTQKINYTIEEIKDLFQYLKKDIETLSLAQAEDFRLEMEYALKQLERGNNAKDQLWSIGKLIKDIGINVFANLVASPIYELLKPFLGL